MSKPEFDDAGDYAGLQAFMCRGLAAQKAVDSIIEVGGILGDATGARPAPHCTGCGVPLAGEATIHYPDCPLAFTMSPVTGETIKP
jgi:hypothetical protein